LKRGELKEEKSKEPQSYNEQTVLEGSAHVVEGPEVCR
jgi:hypothetical protein